LSKPRRTKGVHGSHNWPCLGDCRRWQASASTRRRRIGVPGRRRQSQAIQEDPASVVTLGNVFVSRVVQGEYDDSDTAQGVHGKPSVSWSCVLRWTQPPHGQDPWRQMIAET
jgi:hypothetical protein